VKSLVVETFRIARASTAFFSSTAFEGSISLTTKIFGARLRFGGFWSSPVGASDFRFVRGRGEEVSISNVPLGDCGGTLPERLS
jgi:hypothetical protein